MEGPALKRRSKLWLVLPDLHIPSHDPQAIGCCLKVAKILQPSHVLILGDWLDMPQWGRHGRISMHELRRHKYAEAVDQYRYYADELQKDGAELVALCGNHEYWLERFCVSPQAGMAGEDIFDFMDPGHLLAEDRKRFTWVPYMQDAVNAHHIAPNLIACHGWSAAKHAAARHLQDARTVSIVYGHTHRQQYDSTRDPISGEVLKAWSPGCLSKLQPFYRHGQPTAWVHGFSLIYQSHRDERDWTEYNVTINKGRCILPDGTEVVA